MRLLLLSLLLCPPAIAAELVAQPTANDVGIRIDSLTWPADFAKELTSGLTNRLFVRVSLVENSTVLERHTAEVAIRYELWDETFIVSTRVDGREVDNRVQRDLAQAMAFLAALEIPRLFVATPLPKERDLVLRAELLLNPIGREKLRMLRKWVADNSTPEAGGEAASSANNALFNRIFEQYADGEQLAATWRVALESRAFRMTPPANERR